MIKLQHLRSEHHLHPKANVTDTSLHKLDTNITEKRVADIVPPHIQVVPLERGLLALQAYPIGVPRGVFLLKCVKFDLGEFILRVAILYHWVSVKEGGMWGGEGG